MVSILKYFCEITIAREKGRLALLNAIQTEGHYQLQMQQWKPLL